MPANLINRRASMPCALASLQAHTHNDLGARNLQQENNELLSRVKEVEEINHELQLQLQLQQLLVQKAAEGETSLRRFINSYRDSIERLEEENRSLRQDFRSESARADRFESQNKELRLELNVVKRQLQQYQTVQMENISRRRAEALNQYRLEYEQQQTSRTHVGRQAGGLGSRGVTECDVGDPSVGYDTVDLGPVTSYPPVPNGELSQSTGHTSKHKLISSENAESGEFFRDSQEDELECPGCGTGFSVNETEQFLQHTDNCS